MEKAPNDRPRNRLTPVETRVHLVGAPMPTRVMYTTPEMPDKHSAVFEEIRVASFEYANKLLRIFDKNEVDIGRAIAAIDTIQHAKNISCDALELPELARRVDEANDRGN